LSNKKINSKPKKVFRMRKKIFLLAGIAAFSTAVAFNINAGLNNNALSDVALANIEALATGESDSGQGTLYGNTAGTKFCCCPGNNDCSSPGCSGC
jgi:hypothetical protein